MVKISDEDFEKIVTEEYDAIPDTMFGNLDNVVIFIENQPPEQRPRLYGLYCGHPLTNRGMYGYGELPDRITLYQNNIQQHSLSLEDLRARVRVTLVHEIGHYFGLDDKQLEELGWA
ncbi:metallopeptidase family protein [Lysinibacter sp. HNR]|uniref:metallopeptidase family protein n=1 Tax=Lysinibacter sp. HNR TaxID=3031408 RepID=UPI0024353138|nr:metallopeptidase family protein [Lysinibacter sp. HNR]WGD37147.1 metallopeptidase family protein [Lysinibacter sp. HNR]